MCKRFCQRSWIKMEKEWHYIWLAEISEWLMLGSRQLRSWGQTWRARIMWRNGSGKNEIAKMGSGWNECRVVKALVGDSGDFSSSPTHSLLWASVFLSVKEVIGSDQWFWNSLFIVICLSLLYFAFKRAHQTGKTEVSFLIVGKVGNCIPCYGCFLHILGSAKLISLNPTLVHNPQSRISMVFLCL